MAEEEEAAVEGPPPVETKCFKSCGQIYYGDCQRQPDGRYVRQGFGRQVITGQTLLGQAVTLGVYEGNWENQRMVGRGKYKWNDGSSYEGDFVDGQMEGNGSFTWADGSFYSGAWLKGEMHGQGRFESRQDGDFLEGFFRRNCYQEFDGRWIDVLSEHRQMERRMLLEGDKRRILVVRISSPGELDKAVRRVQEEENLIPFIVSDQSVTDSPLSWLEGATEESTVHVSHVALAKRRQHDCQQIFHEKIRNALLTAKPFTVVFGDPKSEGTGEGEGNGNPQEQQEQQGLPQAWRLSELFDAHSFPPELFDLKLFHGRHKADFFLPLEKRSPWLKPPGADGLLDAAAVPGPGGEEGAAGDPPPAAAEEGAEEGALGTAVSAGVPGEGMLKETPTVYLLRFCAVALGKIESEKGSDAIREDAVAQFGAHLPLHRCAILVLSKEPYLPKKEDLHASS